MRKSTRQPLSELTPDQKHTLEVLFSTGREVRPATVAAQLGVEVGQALIVLAALARAGLAELFQDVYLTDDLPHVVDEVPFGETVALPWQDDDNDVEYSDPDAFRYEIGARAAEAFTLE